MREIQLIGKYSHLSAIVDDEDYEYLNQFRWYGKPSPNGDVYARGTNGEVRNRFMHRIIMGLLPGDSLEVDHIHHKTLDNRRSELRIVTRAEQRMNVRGRVGTSKYSNIVWDEGRKKWRCVVQIENKNIYFGRFNSEELAARTADVVLVLTRGRFANLNFAY